MNQRQVNIFSSKIKLRRFFTNKTVPEKEKNTLGCSLGQRKDKAKLGLSRRNGK